MEDSFEHAKPHERQIYQRYTDKCAKFHASATVSVFFTAVATMIMPLIAADQVFPVNVKYPFEVEYEPMRSLIYLHQTLCVWQCFSAVCLTNFIALLIWFTAARFEILCQQCRAVANICDIFACIRQQIKLLRYAQEMIIATRMTLLSMTIICTWAILASGLTIISPSTFEDKTQFTILCSTGLLEVFACAWPADHLMDATNKVAEAIYESPWYNQDVPFQRNVCFIVLRSQTPVVITMSSILPALSLNYYASYVSSAFSYLMTLRIVFVENAAINE